MDIILQKSLLEAVQVLAEERLKNVNFTKSYLGSVKEINGSSCTVELSGDESICIIPDNLRNMVAKDDIVIVQDINNSRRQKIVQGVVGAIGCEVDYFHIYDPVEDRIVSSIEQLYDEESGQVLNVRLEIE